MIALFAAVAPIEAILTSSTSADLSRWLLVMAIAALGMKTSLRAMTEVGGGHIGVVLIETLVMLGAAVLLVKSMNLF